MPRPKTIPWKKRVAIFLAYRQFGRKVNPVANRYAVARSTVRIIVEEFVDMNFSDQPRAKVSEAMLRKMQEQHLARVVESLRAGIGDLNIGPGTDDEAGRQRAAERPFPVQEELRWHLRNTNADQVILEATKADKDYLSRESDAWRGLKMALEEACKLPERDSPFDQDPEPHLLPALKRTMRRTFIDGAFQAQPPPLNWLIWELGPDDERVLRLFCEPIAIGGPEDHQQIKAGVESFLASGFQEHQRRHAEVDRLRQDMGLIQEVLYKEKETITEDEVRGGICPACPYPEASLDLTESPGCKKTRSTKESQHE